MLKTAIYPGTFDPVTNGHIDLMVRALKIFDQLIVAVAVNDRKIPLFTLEERVELLKKCVPRSSKIKITSFDGLLVDYARSQKSTALVRGLRAVSDFEYEFQMALMNRKLDKDIETIYLMPSEQYTCLNSGLVKEVARMGGRLDGLVPALVSKTLKRKYQQLKERKLI
jgi:pantetheine-phosphate adenylyltransferase